MVFIITSAIIFLIDSMLVGISFYALKARFKWVISPKLCFVILLLLFIIFENSLLPILYVAEITITVGSDSIANMMGIMPNEPAVNLFQFGLGDWILWCIEALIGGYVGSKLFK